MVSLFVRLLAFTFVLAAPCMALSQPLAWFLDGRPTHDAIEAVQVLLDARAEGLEPRDYDAAGLAALLRQPPLAAAAQAQADAALTAALQRYLAELRHGRIDPRSLGAKFAAPQRLGEDSTALLRDAIAAHRVAQVLQGAEPRLPMYASLRAALARYRALGEHPAWQFALPPLPRGRKLVPGRPYPGTQVLAQRLAALGDLDPGMPPPQGFDDALVSALRAFQERHGLTPDGVLGASTLRQLEVTPAQRARQIELAMERLRWTPFLQGPRMIVINVPEFVLRAYEVNDGRIAVRLAMKVIVGKALRTRTPLLGEDLRFVEFSPYWNVPPSIARSETLPRLARDPEYFEREGLEFVTPSGEVVSTLSAANLDAVAHRGWRIRQRPGPQNALGGIKFVFPNNDNIYLHDTPSRRLFERDRRDFSHGCIRIEAPVALAKLVLQDEPDWTEERILATIANGVSTTVRLKQPVPVLIAYGTVIVRDSSVSFYPDVYGEDAKLDRALRAR